MWTPNCINVATFKNNGFELTIYRKQSKQTCTKNSQKEEKEKKNNLHSYLNNGISEFVAANSSWKISTDFITHANGAFMGIKMVSRKWKN